PRSKGFRTSWRGTLVSRPSRRMCGFANSCVWPLGRQSREGGVQSTLPRQPAARPAKAPNDRLHTGCIRTSFLILIMSDNGAEVIRQLRVVSSAAPLTLDLVGCRSTLIRSAPRYVVTAAPMGMQVAIEVPERP